MTPFHNPLSKNKDVNKPISSNSDVVQKNYQNQTDGKENRNLGYERQLKTEFGLDYATGGWTFDGGRIIDDMVNTLKDPHVCWSVLNKLKDPLKISQVCVVGGNRMVIIACNSKPKPTCLVTGLNVSTVAELIAISIKEGNKVVDYRSTWMLTI